MNRFKNIVTNILGLIFWGFAVKNLASQNQGITYILSLIVIGIVLFRFKFSETKRFITRFFDVSVNKYNITNERRTETLDPDKKEKPKTKG